MKKVNIKLLILSLAIPLVVGGVAALIIRNHLGIYDDLNLPSFAPPYYVFGIVWGILYVLMGISFYLALRDKNCDNEIIILFAVQLFFNFCWPIAFFNFKLFWFSFVWLLVLMCLVVWLTIKYFRINRIAGWLQIPYIAWLIFASVLNLVIAIMN